MELFFLIVLVVIMAIALGSGFPVAFALPGSAIITITLAAAAGYLTLGDTSAFFHSGGPYEWVSAGVLNLRGVYWEVERDTLIAIPLFIFMGIMLQRSKIAEDLLVTMAQLFGPVPGGLGISVVFVGALLAATTGIVGATVVAMGMISLPAMLRNNYSTPLATGTIAASGTLGQIIPPSIVLIILADQLASAVDQASTTRKLLYKESTGELQMPSVFDVSSTSAGEMFLGAFIPGLLLVGIYMLYILGFALIKPSAAPAVPYNGSYDRKFMGKVLLTLVPPLALIFLVLGSIISGIATVNQAGAIGAAGALIMAGYRLEGTHKSPFAPAITAIVGLGIVTFALMNYPMNVKAATTPQDFMGIYIGAAGTLLIVIGVVWSGWRVLKIENTLYGVMMETAKTTALVFVILLGAAMLTAAFRAFGGEELVREFLLGLPGGFWTQFLIVMLVIFILGFFLDFIEIAVVVVPIVAPILLADPTANITAVWLGVMIGLNIQTSFLTPPFGFALFYLRGVAPAVVKTVQMYKGVIAFIALQLIALTIVGFYPPLVNYLPNRSSFLSDSAPPPRNPRLQFCLDQFVMEKLDADQGATLAAIEAAKSMNVAGLPKVFGKNIASSTKDAEKAIASLADITASVDAVDMAADDYRPLMTTVRSLEKRIRREQEHRDEAATSLGRMQDQTTDKAVKLTAEIAQYDATIADLRAQIPDEWDSKHETFKKLTDAENKARNTYRRAADGAFEDAADLLAILNATAEFKTMRPALDDLRAVVDAAGETVDFEAAEDAAKELESAFRKIDGADEVKDALDDVGKALSKRGKDRDQALQAYEQALVEYDAQLAWRDLAETQLRGDLNTYVDAMRVTIGIRSQDALNREQALYLASCTADHKDLSLNF